MSTADLTTVAAEPVCTRFTISLLVFRLTELRRLTPLISSHRLQQNWALQPRISDDSC